MNILTITAFLFLRRGAWVNPDTLSKRKKMKWAIILLMITNIIYGFEITARRSYFNTVGAVGTVLVHLLLTLCAVICRMYECELEKEQLYASMKVS